jgi:hypothetical protein
MIRRHAAAVLWVAALGLVSCGSPSAPTPGGGPAPGRGRWTGATRVADAGEVPLSSCGSTDPPCRRYGDDRYSPALAINERGQAVAAWHRNDAGFRLHAARFEPGAGWGPDALVTMAPGSFEHRVALAADGTAAAAWNWYVPSFDDVTRSAREGSAGSVSRPGQPWSREQALGGAFDQVRALRVGADGLGFALLSRQCLGYDPACTWGDVLAAPVRDGGWGGYDSVRRKPGSACQEISPHDRAVAVAPSGGGAVAVWMEYDRGPRTFGCPDGSQRLMSSRFDGRWSSPELLDQTETVLGDMEAISVAADARGGALVTYVKTRSVDERGVFALRFRPGGGWQRPERLGDAGWQPVLDGDGEGNALVAWWGTDHRLHARAFDARSQAWSPVQDVPGSSGVGTESYSVATGGPRQGLVAWTLFEGDTGNVLASLLAGGSWSEAQSLHAGAAGRAVGRPSVAMDPSGNAIAAWAEYEGTNESIWANRFVASR